MARNANDAEPRQVPLQQTLHSLVAARARATPDAIAIAAPGRRPCSYARLLGLMNAVGAALNDMGVGRGDRVAIVLPNGPEMAVAFLAVGSVAVCTPLNPAYRLPEFDFYLGDLRAKALLIQAEMESDAREAAARYGTRVVDVLPLTDAEAGSFELPGADMRCGREPDLACEDGVGLVLHTSGTTSRPKMVPLTHLNLRESAHNVARALELTAEDRCLNIMPLFHIHGLVGAMLSSLAAGASVACTPGFQAPRFFDWIRECRPSWYSAVPTMHQAILERAEAHAAVVREHALRLVRSSSASLPPSVMAQLEATFSAPVIEAYGMSEAAHQIASNPLPPRERKPGSVGLPAGPEVAVMDAAGNLLPPGEVGEVVIRGRSVTCGYELNPEANAKAFTAGWFRTGDQGYLDQEGYLYLTGRLKELINRAGEKIAPREVDEALLSHPAVAQAVAFAMPDERLGEDVAAAVVLKEGREATERELQRHVEGRLANFKVPRRVLIVKEVPRGPTGKLQRIGLAARLGPAGGEAVPDERARDHLPLEGPLEETLGALWAEVLGIDEVGACESFFDLGGDSVLAAQVMSRLRSSLGVELSWVDFFGGPTVRQMAATVQRTRPAEDRPVEPSMHAAGQAAARRPGEQEYAERAPSSSQQRLWFLEQLESEKGIWVISRAFRISGKLDCEALGAALNEIVARHESLRTTLAEVDGEPVQRIHGRAHIVLALTDISHLAGVGQEEAISQHHKAEAERPFDISSDLMLRAQLVRLGPTDHVLIVSKHHIATDRHSMDVFYEELSALYDAFAQGEPSPLADPPAQYADFAAAQREWLRGKASERQRAYWTRQLADLPPLSLPADSPRAPSQRFSGAMVSLDLPPALERQVRALAVRCSATPFMVFLAAFKLLLCRLSGQTDIVVGSPVSSRDRTEFEDLIGFFVNVLVLRTDASGDPSFVKLIERVRAVTVSAYDHRALPFEKVVEELDPKRQLNRGALFEVMVNFASEARRVPQLAGCTVTELDRAHRAARYALELYLSPSERGLRLELLYRAALFSRERMKSLLEQYVRLLEQIVDDPARSISSYSLVTDGARRVLPDPAAALPREEGEPLTGVFLARARRAPESTAIALGSRTWTYGELAARALGVAHVLGRLGVRKGGVVAVTGERSFGLICAATGALLSGGVLLPLDPSLPEARQQVMIRKGRVSVLLHVGQSDLTAARRTPLSPPRMVRVDPETGELPESDASAPASDNGLPQIAPEDPAALFFTSGSRGEPKGVLCCHAGYSGFLKWQREQFSIGPGDRVAQLTSLSFDVVMRDIFLPLTSGGTLCLPEPDLSPEDVLTWLDRSRVTVLHAVPSLAQFWLNCFNGDSTLEHLRWVFFAGEALTDGLVRRWRAAFPAGGRIVNLYGLTETTLVKCAWMVPEEPRPGVQPVGRPLHNCQALVVSRSGQLCGVGEPGEVLLRVPFPLLGYVDSPEENRKRFVKNPFRKDVEEVVCRTGDLGRYLPDGSLEVIGRLDNQVKIRGVRVEPEEIEAVLGRHPDVASCAAGPVQGEGGPFLAAWAVPVEGRCPDEDQLRAFLSAYLPAAMLPEVFTLIDRLPLTANGKLDRSALPVPVRDGRKAGEYVAPATPVEQALAQIWADVLGVERVGLHDDFFALGGHSLKAIQVASRVRERFDVDVPLPLLFEAPTIAALSVAIDGMLLAELHTDAEHAGKGRRP